VYPDDDTRYRQVEATMMIQTSARPDGTASFSVRDVSGETHVTQFADVATDGYRLDVPTFGEWGPVVNATLGAAPGPPA